MFKDFEVILVDNNSSDGSVDFVKRNFREVQIVQLEDNYGFCRGNNFGIAHTHGEFIVFLNNDTIADRFWLQEIHKAFTNFPNAGICASKMLFLSDNSIIDNAGIDFSPFLVGHQRGRMKQVKLFSKYEEIFGASGGALAIRRKVLDNIGWFDEDFFAFAEDTDLSFRSQLRGYKCIFVPTAKVFHFGGGTVSEFSKLSVYLNHRNMEWVVIKNVPAKLLIKYGWLHFLYSFAWILFWIFKGKGAIVTKAKIDAFKKITLMFRKRKRIQRTRIASDKYIERLIKKRYITSLKAFLYLLWTNKKFKKNTNSYVRSFLLNR